MKTVGIIQARMGSSRLPGKVLAELIGQPMLAHVIDRTRRASTIDEVVVATTTEPVDAVVEALSQARGWACFRGSQEDVLDRFYQAALLHQADVVVRLTADCPLIDPVVIDQVVGAFLEHLPHYASNVMPPRSFPRGLDTEVFSFEALACAWREDDNPLWREHVTPFLYRHPERFRLWRFAADADYSEHRWTVDTPEDWRLVCRIFEALGDNQFSWRDVLSLLRRHPEWSDLNRGVTQKAA